MRLLQRQPAYAEVAGHTAANRIRVIHNYLDWLVRYHMASYRLGATERERLWNEWTSCKDTLAARLPRHKGRNTIGQREGLQSEVAERLLNVTLPTSPENPWRGQGTCIRNALLVRWLYELGLRRGEVLNVKIPDINFQSEQLTVVRRIPARTSHWSRRATERFRYPQAFVS